MFGGISRDSLTIKNQSYNLSLGVVLRLPVKNRLNKKRESRRRMAL
jgi:hypothetical protein